MTDMTPEQQRCGNCRFWELSDYAVANDLESGVGGGHCDGYGPCEEERSMRHHGLNLCADCTHFEERGASVGPYPVPGCVRPLSVRIDLVHGGPADRLRKPAADERRAGRTLFTRRQRCGPGGLYFVERATNQGADS